MSGNLNGKPFSGLFDADERFATVLEVFGTGGAYLWVAFEQIESITLNPPQHPRDVILRPAHLVVRDGTEGDVLLPGLYPGTYLANDESIKLGRTTEWVENDGEVNCGLGGKMFLIDDELSSLTTWNKLEMAPA
jgi:type VI secretion system protein ImpE